MPTGRLRNSLHIYTRSAFIILFEVFRSADVAFEFKKGIAVSVDAARSPKLCGFNNLGRLFKVRQCVVNFIDQ